MKSIKVIGAKGHNLKNITVELPKDKMVVVTGLSGSGKSSLIRDVFAGQYEAESLLLRSTPSTPKASADTWKVCPPMRANFWI